MRGFGLVGLVTVAATAVGRGQSLQRFTPEVALGVVSYAVRDISEDGISTAGSWPGTTSTCRRVLSGCGGRAGVAGTGPTTE